jgi:hypothetical protein
LKKHLNMASATSRKTPKSTSKIISPIEEGYGKLTGTLTVERSEEIMRKHGLRPMTAANRKKFAKFLK